MTKQELNRDVKRLLKKAKAITKGLQNSEYYDAIEKEVKPEFFRLYRADTKFEYMNKESILIMLRLNLRHRFEPLHMFGIYIDVIED
jgi:hypothetical protein